MPRYKIWDKQETIYTPSGEEFTPEQWLDRYKWAKRDGVKMVVSGELINGAFCGEFETMKHRAEKMGVTFTDGMTDEEVLAAIEEFEMNPPGADQPSIEERTAAALEAQVLMAMPEETEPAVAKLSTMSVARTAKVAAASNAAPAESAAFQRIQRNYQKGLWSAALVSMAASRGQITSDEASKILNG